MKWERTSKKIDIRHMIKHIMLIEIFRPFGSKGCGKSVHVHLETFGQTTSSLPSRAARLAAQRLRQSQDGKKPWPLPQGYEESNIMYMDILLYVYIAIANHYIFKTKWFHWHILDSMAVPIASMTGGVPGAEETPRRGSRTTPWGNEGWGQCRFCFNVTVSMSCWHLTVMSYIVSTVETFQSQNMHSWAFWAR